MLAKAKILEMARAIQGAVVRSQLQHGIEQRDCRVKQPPL